MDINSIWLALTPSDTWIVRPRNSITPTCSPEMRPILSRVRREGVGRNEAEQVQRRATTREVAIFVIVQRQTALRGQIQIAAFWDGAQTGHDVTRSVN